MDTYINALPPGQFKDLSERAAQIHQELGIAKIRGSDDPGAKPFAIIRLPPIGDWGVLEFFDTLDDVAHELCLIERIGLGEYDRLLRQRESSL